MIDLTLLQTRSSLRGIQRRCKDPVRKERIGLLLQEMKPRETATGKHLADLDRYTRYQLQLLAA